MPPPPALPGVEHRYYDLPTGVRAHVACAGPEDAPPLVALHGFPQHWYIWRRLIGLLASEYRVLAMDTRGLGWSGPPADGDYRKARLAEDAVALLDVLELERAGLVGHDWGGWAGFLAALQSPERWTGYVATGIAHPWQPPRAVLRSLPRLAYQPPIATPFLGPRIIPALVPRFLRVGWGDRSTYDREAEEVYAARYREPARAEAASRYYRDFLTREAPSGMAGAFDGRRLTIPTRLLYGDRDPLGTALAQDLEHHGDDARTEFLAGCGHFVPEERPAEVAAAIRSLPSAPWS
jgi:pimeloyl-ACP methyl ester carboxylesterase